MTRRQDIELLRVISAFGIVWFHSSAVGRDIAYSALIVFLVLSIYLSAQSTKPTRSVVDRAKRLLVPWLVWFVFYGAINLAIHKPFIPLNNGIISGIFVGTRVHLWFLPFIFFILIAFDWLRNRMSPRFIGYACSTLAILIFATASDWRPWALKLGAPFGQYADAVNGIIIGAFLAHYYYMPNLVRSLLLIIILGLAAYLSMLPMSGVGVYYFIGVSISAAILLFNLPLPAGINFNWLSECTLGIYLIHPFYIMIFSHSELVSRLSMPFVVFLASAISVILIKRIAPSVAKYTV